VFDLIGGRCRIRTCDPLIKSKKYDYIFQPLNNLGCETFRKNKRFFTWLGRNSMAGSYKELAEELMRLSHASEEAQTHAVQSVLNGMALAKLDYDRQLAQIASRRAKALEMLSECEADNLEALRAFNASCRTVEQNSAGVRRTRPPMQAVS
jgi:hypothetical protein